MQIQYVLVNTYAIVHSLVGHYRYSFNTKKQMQDEFDRQFGNCIVNIIVGEN